MKELLFLPFHEAHKKLAQKEISCRELTAAVLAQIERLQPQMNAFITIEKERALKEAEIIDREMQKGKGGSLLRGIPFGLKDIFITKGMKTTCASRILENFVPPFDGTAVKKMKEQEIVLVGKQNMDEFAMGSSNENSFFGPVRNPWNFDLTPGGSSGGSAAAVASGQGYASLGTDTGGSVRLPAAFCGIVGLKPTYGRVSRYGIVAFASSLDQIGPLTRDVEDCAHLLQVIAGHDPLDSTSSPTPVPDYSTSLNRDIKGIKIGIPKEYFVSGINSEVRDAIDKGIKSLAQEGAVVSEISLPHTRYAVPAYYLVATSEASSNLARYDGVKYGYRSPGAKELVEMYNQTRGEGFGVEVKRRIMLGTFALSSGYYDAYYKKASQVRTLIKKDFEEVFKKVDLIVTPISPTPSFKLGEKIGDPLAMYLSDIFTISINLAGVPAISIPCGWTQQQLPIGMQIIGPFFGEALILRVAHAFERITGLGYKPPPRCML